MTAKEYLCGIDDCRDQARFWRWAAGNIINMLCEFGIDKDHSEAGQRLWAKGQRMADEMNSKAAEHEAQACCRLEIINVVPDERARRFLLLHYDQGMTWEQIAFDQDVDLRYLYRIIQTKGMPPIQAALSEQA